MLIWMWRSIYLKLTQHSLCFHVTQEDWCLRRGLTSTRCTLLSFILRHHICAAVLNASPLHIERARSRFQKNAEASKLMDWRQLREGKAVPPLTWTIVQADSNWTRCKRWELWQVWVCFFLFQLFLSFSFLLHYSTHSWMEGEKKCLREETIQNFTISPRFCPFVDQRIDAEGEKKKKSENVNRNRPRRVRTCDADRRWRLGFISPSNVAIWNMYKWGWLQTRWPVSHLLHCQ